MFMALSDVPEEYEDDNVGNSDVCALCPRLLLSDPDFEDE
jgi:hypothetical protein